MSRKKIMAAALSLALAASQLTGLSMTAAADSSKVVTLGANLSQDQMNTMMNYFGASYSEAEIIYINNQNERDTLSAYVPLEQIGTRTFSCAYVKPTESGGIHVKTANLTWVTANMIATTLSTSGVTNCEVIAAAPFAVSGTGALTGIIMAYEKASGTTLEETKKELATEELVVTGQLGDAIGQTDATAIVNEVKIEVLGEELTDLDSIESAVKSVAASLGYELSDDQVSTLTGLMEKLSAEDYDYDAMEDTLLMVDENVTGTEPESEEDIIVEEGVETVDGTASETEASILDSVDESALGTDVISGSTDEPAPVEVVEPETDLTVLPETEELIPVETQTEIYAEPQTEVYAAPATEAAETEFYAPAETEGLVLSEPETESESEITFDPDDLSDEDHELYTKLVEYLDKNYNDADLDEDGNAKVVMDAETALRAYDYVANLFLSMKLDGIGDYEPVENPPYENIELNYLNDELQKLFVNHMNGDGTEIDIFNNYSIEDCSKLYENIMKFFAGLYDETEEETEGLEILDDTAETEGLDVLE